MQTSAASLLVSVFLVTRVLAFLLLSSSSCVVLVSASARLAFPFRLV
jgi:hypothetical protein